MTILVNVSDKKYLPYYKYKIYKQAKIKIISNKKSRKNAKINK